MEHNHQQNGNHALENILDEQSFATASQLFKILSDGTRLRLFYVLCHAEVCVVDLAKMLNASCPAISHHLAKLKSAGLITHKKHGKEVFYKWSNTEVCHALHRTIENVLQVSCPLRQTDFCNHAHPFSDENCNVIERVHNYLISNLDKHVTIQTLSKMFLLNPTTLKQKFKACYGHSIAFHVHSHRMEKSLELIKQGNTSLGQVAKEVGYLSQSKFTQAFKKHFGLNPKDCK